VAPTCSLQLGMAVVVPVQAEALDFFLILGTGIIKFWIRKISKNIQFLMM
jgi:hypothetical protein